MTIERATAAELLARADDWLEQTRADGELRAGWSRPTDAVLVLGSAQRVTRPGRRCGARRAAGRSPATTTTSCSTSCSRAATRS